MVMKNWQLFSMIHAVILLPASPASCTHKFGKGLSILKSVQPADAANSKEVS